MGLAENPQLDPPPNWEQHFDGEGKPYLWYCESCRCYEHDCHDSAWCIRKHPAYIPVAQRSAIRQARAKLQPRIVEA